MVHISYKFTIVETKLEEKKIMEMWQSEQVFFSKCVQHNGPYYGEGLLYCTVLKFRVMLHKKVMSNIGRPACPLVCCNLESIKYLLCPPSSLMQLPVLLVTFSCFFPQLVFAPLHLRLLGREKRMRGGKVNQATRRVH